LACVCPNDLPTCAPFAHMICAFASPANWTGQTKLTCENFAHVFTSFEFKVLDFYGSLVISTARF